MFFSKRFGLLFIASPKTGSTSVELYLKELDPEGERFKTTLPERVIDSGFVKTPSLGHATASEFKEVLGEIHYSELSTFRFVRDPLDKLVSTYFFKKQGSVWKALRHTKGSRRFRVALRTAWGVILARLLPFSLWVRIWPMKRCSDYFLDHEGNLLVNYLGSTERLNQDLLVILRELGIQPPAQVSVPRANASRHSVKEDYIGSEGLESFLKRKYLADIKLCELVRDGVWVNTKGAGLKARL